jgi:hypothetical protein
MCVVDKCNRGIEHLTGNNGSTCRKHVPVCMFVRHKSHVDRPGSELEPYKPDHSMNSCHVMLQELHSACFVWSSNSCLLSGALRYKPEGREFDSRWCHWNFSLTQSFRPHYGPGVDLASNRNEYQKYFLGVKPAGA